jgi:hypothetical protein
LHHHWRCLTVLGLRGALTRNRVNGLAGPNVRTGFKTGKAHSEH